MIKSPAACGVFYFNNGYARRAAGVYEIISLQIPVLLI